MIIKGFKSIRVLNSHLILKKGEKFYIGIELNSENLKLVKKLGFSEQLNNGERILPSQKLGRFYKYNIYGKEIVDKTQREIITRELPYRVTDWHGTEHTGTYFRDYDRYKRKIIWNYNLELSIISKNGYSILIVNKCFGFNEDEKDEIMFSINLLLSIFGEVNILKENLELYDNTVYKKVNWTILPLGDSAFEKIEEIIKARYKESYKQGPILKRQEFIKSLNPSEVIMGNGGFGEYFAYVFKKDGITILESKEYGNAIYILGLKWEEISKMTKKEILEGGLEKERIIHKDNYYKEVKKYFNINK